MIKDEHLYLTSSEGGYMPDGDSPLVNFTEFDDVISEAQTELIVIKAEQAKTNSSVETEDGN